MSLSRYAGRAVIICHNLKLVFLHVPKCAGTALRTVFEQDLITGSSVSLFDFGYSHILRRHVDLAHLPLMDLRHFPEWRCLEAYHTLACIRDPYARMASACREFYRQHSRETELQMRERSPTPEQLLDYLRALPAAHEAHDLRYVHSFPMVWFTHYGDRPMVDSLLRCEQLPLDIQKLKDTYNLPSDLGAALLSTVRQGGKNSASKALQPLEHDANLVAMTNLLHREDFSTFGYPQRAESFSDPVLKERIEACLNNTASHAIPHTSLAPRMRWYWGRNSNSVLPPMAPSRKPQTPFTRTEGETVD